MTVDFLTDDVIITTRGDIIENRYLVHVAVVDLKSNLLSFTGDPTRITLARSALKPAQALAVLETGGPQRFGFDDVDLALMCGSHSSEPSHISRALSMLDKTQAQETDLRCGGHPAINETVNSAWIKNGFTPTAVCNNCSGKHAGFLAGAKALNAPLESYHLQDHPIHSRVESIVKELCGPNTNDVKWAIDGCNLPAPATSLERFARMYATFSDAADATAMNVTAASARVKLQGQIFRAMADHPEQVGGEGRFCTELMQAFQGSLIGKVGADGFYGLGIRASEQTRRLGSTGGIGIAVKIEDGHINTLYSAVAEILEQLQIGTTEMRQKLAHWHYPKLLNTAGVVIGQVSHRFKVRDAKEYCIS